VAIPRSRERAQDGAGGARGNRDPPGPCPRRADAIDGRRLCDARTMGAPQHAAGARARADSLERPSTHEAGMTDVAAATKTFHQYIAGAWCDSTSGATFESRNPADQR